MPSSNWHLKRYYNAANRAFWNGSLPDATCVYGELDCQAQVEHSKGIRPLVTISPKVKKCGWNAVAMCLLHEMVHIKVIERFGARHGHGPRFQREMLRLAKAGAFTKHW